MTQTVVGLFNKPSDAQQAVQQLINSGFSQSDVDLSIGSTNTDTTSGSKNFDLDATGSTASTSTATNEHESGVSRFFKNLFGSDDDTNTSRYNNAASRGSSIVTVHAQSADQAEKAADILDDNGAINVDEDAEGYNTYNTNTGAAPVGAFNETAGASAATPDMETTTGTFDTANKNTFTTNDDVTGKTSIPVIEENLAVGKRTVETGGMRLRSRIVERPVEENLRLREERVYVNRTPVNRTASSADFDTFTEGEIEMREHAEVPVVAKEARIVEEVSLGKESNERSETIRDTVRKTEVEVENIDATTTRSVDTDRTGN